MKTVAVWLVLILPVLLCACSPGIKVVKNPKENNKGIRYYRPKPYLFISPAGKTELPAKEGEKTVVSPSDQYVSMELKYLPDFSEEYAISVKSGLGTANVEITLDEGWNLTSINQDLDSKTNENISAVADLIKAFAPGGLTGGAVAAPKRDGGQQLTIRATNIPLGFYESVIGVDPWGKKQLYGWRYVGFAPFNSCPLAVGGATSACCDDGTLDIYGLTFEQGVMVFKRLHTIQEYGFAIVDSKTGMADDTKEKRSFGVSEIRKLPALAGSKISQLTLGSNKNNSSQVSVLGSNGRP